VNQNETAEVKIRISVVGDWLVGAGGKYLDEMYRQSAHAQPVPKLIAVGEYERLAKLFPSGTPNNLTLQSWVEQLEDPTHRYLAFRLLERLCTSGFFSDQRMSTSVVPSLVDALTTGPLRGRVRRGSNNWLTGISVFQHGAPGSSGPSLVRQMLAALRITKSSVSEVEGVQRIVASDDPPTVVLVLDDFAGSGKQLTRVVGGLTDALAEVRRDWESVVTVAVGVGVVPSDRTVEKLSELPCEVVTGLTLGPEIQAFHPDAGIFDSSADRQTCADLFSAIGKSLGSQPPLGWDDQGLLVAFEHNCPNNTLPAIWKEGTYAGKPWIPVLQRIMAR
jgi:hypothetical protein